jgi:uncharacterized membrane protein
VVIFLCAFFIVKLIMTERDMGGLISFYIIFSISVLLALLTTHLVYTTNERRLKRLIEKRGEGNGNPS